MNNKKRINYEVVKQVMALNLSVRKSVEMLNEMGIKISLGAYTKYKNEHLSNSNQIDPIAKVNTSMYGEILPISNAKVNTTQNDVAGVIINELGKVNTSDNSNQIDPIAKVNTSENEEKSDINTKVNTSENTAKKDYIIVEYRMYRLKAVSHEHRDYRKCGLSKKNLYEVLQIEELKDYQFDDLLQLRMAKVNPRLVYNWKYGRCINDYDKPLN